MSKKMKKELMSLDFYEILGLSMGADEQEIRKSYRKNALKCHPDKNPDNKDAAQEFDRLQKILEILLDAGTRKAYDKVLRGRKAAAVRAREADAKTQKLRTDLEVRERQAELRETRLSEEEKLRRELRRLQEEGQRLIDEELNRVNQQVEQELYGSGKKKPEPPPDKRSHKVKVKWVTTEDWPGYTEEDIKRLFHKWGDINALVMKQRTKKGTALIDFATKSGADMAVQFEKGMVGKLLEVTHVSDEPPTKKTERHQKNSGKTKEADNNKGNYDFETIADMNRRRAEERRKLIEEIMKEEGGPK